MSEQGFASMTVSELREEAKKYGIKNVSTLKKNELVDLLNKVEEKIQDTKKNQMKINK